MSKARLVAFHLLVPPMLAELLTGNAPPARFFHPILLLAFILLYGCAVLLIRECRARWRMQWSILFLGVAFAILEEGLTTKAFFNPQWPGVGKLSGYGTCWGVQWVWTLGVTFSHATLSVLVPITIADRIWPGYRDVRVLGKRGLFVCATGVFLVVALGMLTIGDEVEGRVIPFFPHPLLLVAAQLAVLACCWLAYRLRGTTVATTAMPLLPPSAFFVMAFLALPFFVVVPNTMVEEGASGLAAVLVELAAIALILLFVFLQLCHREVRTRHTTALVLGFLMPFLLLTPLQEFHKGFTPHKNGTGMTAVGILALVALLFWRRAALKTEARSAAVRAVRND